MVKGNLLRVLPMTDEVREVYSEYKNNHHKGDSGFDLVITQDQTIEPKQTSYIGLGIKIAAFKVDYDSNTQFSENSDLNSRTEKQKTTFEPYSVVNGISWLLLPRSSMSKTPLRMANSIGLIDAGYRGEVKIAVDNIRDDSYTVKKGDKLVQAVAFNGKPISFEVVESLDETSRGEGGFGSTSQDLQLTQVAKKQKSN